jgi:hypothetical protein
MLVFLRMRLQFGNSKSRVGTKLDGVKDRKEEKMPATKVKQKRVTKQRRTTKRSSMTMSNIRNKAKKLGIRPGKMAKTELIHTIQSWEGYTPCFGWSNGDCGNGDCCFIRDCLKTKA